jgi:hypothetical protein
MKKTEKQDKNTLKEKPLVLKREIIRQLTRAQLEMVKGGDGPDTLKTTKPAGG